MLDSMAAADLVVFGVYASFSPVSLYIVKSYQLTLPVLQLITTMQWLTHCSLCPCVQLHITSVTSYNTVSVFVVCWGKAVALSGGIAYCQVTVRCGFLGVCQQTSLPLPCLQICSFRLGKIFCLFGTSSPDKRRCIADFVVLTPITHCNTSYCVNSDIHWICEC